MTDNIWGERFFATGTREAVWHHVGHYNKRGTTAVKTVKKIGGNYPIEVIPLTFELNGQTFVTDYKAIVRGATKDDKARMLGAPVQNYQLIKPLEAAKMWDERVGAPVETMGFLAKGAEMFITAVLPAYDVGGFDPVQNYLLFHNPMRSGQAAGAFITGVRVVCANTLRSGIGAASQTYTIPHRPGVDKLLGEWLEKQWLHAQNTVRVLEQAHNVLLKKSITDEQIKWISTEVYTMPTAPDRNKPRITEWEKVMEAYEKEVHMTTLRRAAVMELWGGRGTGLDDSRLRGTAWAALNTFTEVETFSKQRSTAIVMGLTNGDRAKRLMKAETLLATI